MFSKEVRAFRIWPESCQGGDRGPFKLQPSSSRRPPASPKVRKDRLFCGTPCMPPTAATHHPSQTVLPLHPSQNALTCPRIIPRAIPVRPNLQCYLFNHIGRLSGSWRTTLTRSTISHMLNRVSPRVRIDRMEHYSDSKACRVLGYGTH